MDTDVVVSESRRLTDPLLDFRDPRHHTFASAWTGENRCGQCKATDNHRSHTGEADLDAQQPGSQANLNDVGPNLVDLPPSPDDGVDLRWVSDMVSEARVLLTSVLMRVTAAELLMATVLNSVVREDTADTRTPRSMVMVRALRCS